MNKVVIGGVIVLVIVLVGLVVVNTKPAVAPTTIETETGTMDNMDTMDMNGMESATVDPDTDLSGIHIMADGSVMLGDGTTVPDASVTADGMIMLPDGRMVAPAMDMRQ